MSYWWHDTCNNSISLRYKSGPNYNFNFDIDACYDRNGDQPYWND